MMLGETLQASASFFWLIALCSSSSVRSPVAGLVSGIFMMSNHCLAFEKFIDPNPRISLRVRASPLNILLVGVSEKLLIMSNVRVSAYLVNRKIREYAY